MPENQDFSQALQVWFHIFMHHVMSDFTHSARQCGITMPQLSALFYLWRQEHCGVSDFGEFLGVTSAAASQMIDRLVSLGLLERSEDPHDRRAKQIVLTGKGTDLIKHILQARQKWFEEIQLFLDPDQQEQISAALSLLVGAIQAAGTPGRQAYPCAAPLQAAESTNQTIQTLIVEGTPD